MNAEQELLLLLYRDSERRLLVEFTSALAGEALPADELLLWLRQLEAALVEYEREVS
jgi:hypothetical protein